jgi:hypothetical protein
VAADAGIASCPFSVALGPARLHSVLADTIMSVLSDFYLAEAQQAKNYDVNQQCDEIDRAQYRGMTPLELSTLWAITQKKEWDVAMMDQFPEVLIVDGGQRLIYQVPGAAVKRFASLSEAEVGAAAGAWSQTEELACEAADVQPVVEEIVRLSKRGLETNRNLYLWICV